MTDKSRWILAFDGTCAACQGISLAVSRAAGSGLEVLPLGNEEVRLLRERALGPDAPWKPTLIATNLVGPRAWTGLPLSIRLARLLGPATSLSVLRSLGQLREEIADSVNDTTPARQRIQRRAFLRVGAGATLVARMFLTGTAPASADPVAMWMKANAQKLPTDYAGIKDLPIAYNRAVYTTWTPAQMSAAWSEHLNLYHSSINTPAELEVYAAMLTLARDPATFEVNHPRAVLSALGERAVQTFGGPRAKAIFGTLGPVQSRSLAKPQSGMQDCYCSVESDWCDADANCYYTGCRRLSQGCGWLHNYQCIGCCTDVGC